MKGKRMLVLGIVGSARKNGNSAFLLQQVLRQLQDDFETETIFLSDHDIRPCDGCHYCVQNGSCCIDDDIPTLCRKMKNASAIILCTPSYMGGVTSRMRAFMERTWPLRKGQMTGRVGAHIVTGRRRIGVAAAAVEEYFSRLGMIKVPGVLGFALEAGEVVRDKEAMSQTLRLARDLRNCLSLTERTEHEGERER